MIIEADFFYLFFYYIISITRIYLRTVVAKNPKYDIEPLKNEIFPKNWESYKFEFQKPKT